MVATVVASLIIAFVMVAAAGFQSVKGGVRASEARLHEAIQTSETKLREEIHASETRLNKRIDDLRLGFKGEVKAVNDRLDAMDDKLDRLLEPPCRRPRLPQRSSHKEGISGDLEMAVAMGL